MSKLKPGTMVTMHRKNPPADLLECAPPNGAVGEVIDPVCLHRHICSGYSGVKFPQHPAPHGVGWEVPDYDLVTILSDAEKETLRMTLLELLSISDALNVPIVRGDKFEEFEAAFIRLIVEGRA